MKNLNTRVLYILCLVLIAASVFFTVMHISRAKKCQSDRLLLSEVNNIRYGLLNADEWQIKLSEIMTKKIDEFELTADNREQIKQQVQTLLYRLLNEVERVLKSDMGKIKQFLVRAFVDLDKLRENIPQLTDQLLEELSKPENKENIKSFLLEKMDEVVSETFSFDEQKKLRDIVRSQGYGSKEEASVEIQKRVDRLQADSRLYAILTALSLALAFLIMYFSALKYTRHGLLLMLFATLLFLVNGLAVPMIDIEAKLTSITFSLLGETLVFENQVFFFQSKSILDVVWLLLTDGAWDMAAVGILILLFSVLFPATKIICSYLVTVSPGRYHDSQFVGFFTYRSGKWSMADVFVVALFMAFIGFDGVITNQLEQLKDVNEYVQILTTNGTRLQSGFYLFVLFCLSSLFLSTAIDKAQRHKGMQQIS